MWQVERQCDGSGNVSCQPNWRAPQRNEGYELESLVGWGGLSHGETLGRDASTGKNALIPYRNLNTQLVEDLFFRKKECLHLIFFFKELALGLSFKFLHADPHWVSHTQLLPWCTLARCSRPTQSELVAGLGNTLYRSGKSQGIV